MQLGKENIVKTNVYTLNKPKPINKTQTFTSKYDPKLIKMREEIIKLLEKSELEKK